MTHEQTFLPIKHSPAFINEMRRSADGEEIVPVGISKREYVLGCVLQGLCSNEIIYQQCDNSDDYASLLTYLSDKIIAKAFDAQTNRS